MHDGRDNRFQDLMEQVTELFIEIIEQSGRCKLVKFLRQVLGVKFRNQIEIFGRVGIFGVGQSRFREIVGGQIFPGDGNLSIFDGYIWN